MAEPQMKKAGAYPGKHTSGLNNKIDGDDFFLVGAASTIRRINRDLNGVVFIATWTDVDAVLSTGT